MTYHVTVDYSQPVSDMIEAGKYDHIESSWQNPRAQQEMQEHIGGTGRVEVVIELREYRNDCGPNGIKCQMEADGYRPVTIGEFLMLGATQPQLQTEQAMLCFLYYLGNDLVCMRLASSDSQRRLDFEWLLGGTANKPDGQLHTFPVIKK